MRVPQISSVIVTYQSRDTIAAPLSILALARANGLVECVVVDNNSDDGTAEFVRAKFPWVRLIENEANVGFARACNQGAAIGANPYVLFLNPDASIDCDAIERLLGFMESAPGAGIAAPALLESVGGVQAAGDFPTPTVIVGTAMGRGSGMRSRLVQPGEPAFRTDWVCGAVMLVRRELLREIGSFDPRFFLYFEETDLCRRASRAGWEIWAVGDAAAAMPSVRSATSSDKTSGSEACCSTSTRSAIGPSPVSPTSC